MRCIASLFGLVLSLALVACSEPSSTLLVVVASDYAPDEVSFVVFETFDAAGASIDRRVVDNGDDDSGMFPFSFALHRRGALDQPVRVEARATLGTGAHVTRRAIAPAIAGAPRRLVLFLARACEDVSCDGAELTCIAGACADARVPADALERVEPGRELDLDGGEAPDARFDRPDADPRTDASIDQGRGT